MAHVAPRDYQERIRVDTHNFVTFDLSGMPAISIGSDYVFVYPDFGTPVGHPDYLAHRFHVVTVIARTQASDADAEQEAMYRVSAADGWSGDAFESELFPRTLAEYRTALVATGG